MRRNISCWVNVARGMIALPCLLRCRHGSAIRSKHTAATIFLGLAFNDPPTGKMQDLTPYGALLAKHEVRYPTARICWQNCVLWYLFVAR